MSKSLRETVHASTFFLCLNFYNRFCLGTQSTSCERVGGWTVYYELYVDVLFLVNFMMDYILLLIVRRMLKCSVTYGRICLGAIIGSALTCLVTILPIPYAIIKVLLFHTVVNGCMVQIGLKIKSIRNLVKSLIMLYIGGFLLGGILESFHQYVRFGSLFFAVSLGGYYLVLGAWKFISYIQRWNCYHCDVILYLGEKTYLLKGMIDTGNGLCDPLSGKPVSILNRESAKELFAKENVCNLRYVPYCTIGKKEGVLPTFQIDRMCIRQEREHWVELPLIGISEEMISVGREYDMIINPNLF